MQDRSQREQPHPRGHMNGVNDQVDDFDTDYQGGGKDENEEESDDKVTLKDVAEKCSLHVGHVVNPRSVKGKAAREFSDERKGGQGMT